MANEIKVSNLKKVQERAVFNYERRLREQKEEQAFKEKFSAPAEQEKKGK